MLAHPTAVTAALALAVVLAPAPAVAQRAPASARVLVVDLTGDLPGNLAAAPPRLTRVLIDLLGEGGGSATHAPLDDVLALAGCGEPSDECLQPALELLEVGRLVIGEVEPARPGQVRVSLRLLRTSRPARARRFVVAATDLDSLETGFRARSEAFLRDPDAPPPAPPPRPPAAAPVVTSAPVAAPPEAGFSARRVGPLAWGVTSAGVGMTLVGSFLLLAAADKQSAVDDAPTSTVEDFEALVDLEESGRRFGRWGIGLTVVGAAATVAGIVLIYRHGTASEPSVAVAPSVGAGVGAVVTVRADLL